MNKKIIAAILSIFISSQAFAARVVVAVEGPVDKNLATLVVPKILSATKNDTLFISINSPGGSVLYGKEIVDAIRESPAKTVCVVTDLAASMGALIFLACEDQWVYPGSTLLFHAPFMSLPQGQTLPGDAKIRSFNFTRYSTAWLNDNYCLERAMGAKTWDEYLMGGDIVYSGLKEILAFLRGTCNNKNIGIK